MAPAASRQVIQRGVLSDGIRRVASGLVLGGLLAIVLAQQLRSQLSEVAPLNALTLLAVLLLLAPVALLACWIPARRAAGTAPMDALRHA